MRAALLEGVRRLRVVDDLEAGEPGAGEMRVAVGRAGLCGSDVHVWSTGAFVPEFPVVPGHEVVGAIEAVGPGIEPGRLGQRVVLDSRVPCGECAECAARRYQRCRAIGFLGEVRPGGFAESVCVPADRVWPVPEGLPDAVAVLAEPAAVVLHAWRRLCAVAGTPERVLVLGGGAIGVLQALVIGADAEVVLIEPAAARRDLAARVTGRRVEPAVESETYPVVVDCAGFAGSLGVAAGATRPGGTIACVALHHGPEQIDLNQFVADEQVVVASHVFADEMPETLELLRVRQKEFAAAAAEPIGLAALPAAVEAAAAGRAEWVKLTIDPRLP